MKNEIILASAGSGKTYQLTNRYLAIMAQAYLAGEEPRPDQIVAVTFTRKAAGEFFDEILKKLAAGATSPAMAARIAGAPNDSENPYHEILVQLTPSDYQNLLACFIRRMPGLFLGTLDSFFSQVVRSFPAEFGLSGDFEMIDDHSASQARAEVFRRVFQEAADRPEGSNFLEAFRLATFGKDESSIQRNLNDFIESHHHILLTAASGKLWGQTEAIWPQGCLWTPPPGELLEEWRALLSLVQEFKLSKSSLKFWNELEEEIVSYYPGSSIPSRIEYFYKKFLENWEDIQSGEASFSVGQKLTFKEEACRLISKITLHLASDEIKTKLVRTHGLWLMLSEYERVYANLVRRQGRLTFHDLEVILAGSPASPAPILTQGPDPDTRLRIDYRLDASFRHWMLDEFQDTSFLQWSVIANLVDETIQDDSGERSFFQVGDVKQAIYAWRGGDTRLFEDIYHRYQDIGARSLQSRNLDVSWRSGPDVIEPLNAIFGQLASLPEMSFPPDVLARWKWQQHRVATPNQDRPGFTAYYHPKPEDGSKVSSEDCYRLTLALLEEIQPIRNGLSCALLVQGNKEGRALVDYIRLHTQSEIPVISESDVAIAMDNPVTQAFLALFRLAAHPQNSFAEIHLAMSPLGELLRQQDLSTSQLSSRIRTQVHESGFEDTLLSWIELAREGQLLSDAFANQRLHELTLAARIYDGNSNGSIDDFLAFIESYKLREPNSKTAVQVMTIHKSKGLTFDVVILPELGGNSLTTPRTDIAVQRNRDNRNTEWVLDLPNKALTLADPVLGNYRAHSEAEACYEQLCKFYVALTRARYANYLIAAPLPARSKSDNFIKLLDHTLTEEPLDGELRGVAYTAAYESSLPTSHKDWWKHLPPSPEQEPAQDLPAPPSMQARERPPRRRPSLHSDEETDPARLFARGNNTARELGSAVHEVFQQLQWLDSQRPELPPTATPIEVEAHRQFALTLEDAACRQALAKPTLKSGETVELWREQAFEVIIQNHWTSGIIDRATINRDSSGQALTASLLDYKTDNVASAAEATGRAGLYREQMESYREAASLLLGIPSDKITLSILFTRLPAVVTLQ